MKRLGLVTIFLISSLLTEAQSDRFKSIVESGSKVEDEIKTSTKVFISTTKLSHKTSEDPIYSDVIAQIKEFVLVKTIAESDLVFDCTVRSELNVASTEISVFDSKNGNLLFKTKKRRSSNNAGTIYANGSNYFQKSLERCIVDEVIPLLKKRNRKPTDKIIVIRSASDFRRVLIVYNEDDVTELLKGKEVEVRVGSPAKAKFSLTMEDVVKGLQEKAKVKLQKLAAPSRSPIVLITETYGVEGKGKVGYKGVLYKYKKK